MEFFYSRGNTRVQGVAERIKHSHLSKNLLHLDKRTFFKDWKPQGKKSSIFQVKVVVSKSFMFNSLCLVLPQLTSQPTSQLTSLDIITIKDLLVILLCEQ